ncbi:MAG: hypothetical protein OXE94_10780 [Aestuariivita sp.]|nr:hypothetical protein [Aestuariivita sp.]MCY4203168.1 hypothetical protein [Aestuariivita sp.]MCY4287759.1 hypothetical protein [Aestuariivita sp.]MCY4345718.1 hypothetical protein [Aestuariivita sp.]
MLTIEHEFDHTSITLIDEGATPLCEDVVIKSGADWVTLEQINPRTNQVQVITLSTDQIADLAVALNLPEGVYARS